jgi:nucleoside-diphosphate-sugar epimerase
MKVLFIGGTGVISSACVSLAIERGIELYLLNRGESQRRAPEQARILRGDMRNPNEIKKILDGKYFDAIVDWICYTPTQAQLDVELFRQHTDQFIFISTAATYQKPPATLPITESTPLANPYWDYGQNKIACEQVFMQAYRDEKFPITVVRPSHTYDQSMLPLFGRYTALYRMRQGKRVIVPGDGTSLWTLTHHRDFAKGFVGLLGNPHAIGDAVHITSDEILTWNQIYQFAAHAAGVQARIVHVPSDVIAAHDATLGAGLLGDKSHSAIFDNSKIKRLVPDFCATIPFSRGVVEIINWFNADPVRQIVDEKLDALMDRIIAAQDLAMPK